MRITGTSGSSAAKAASAHGRGTAGQTGREAERAVDDWPTTLRFSQMGEARRGARYAMPIERYADTGRVASLDLCGPLSPPSWC